MIQSKIHFLLLFAFIAIGCKKITVIGHWHRVWPDSLQKSYKYGKDEGDLTIGKDSMYFIKGSSNVNKTSTIPGWHAGGDQMGSWEMWDNNRLVLHFDPSDKMMYLAFTIAYLSEKEMHLYLLDSLHPMIYVKNY